MVIVGTMAVYPLILLVNQLAGPFIGTLPDKLSLLISVVLVSALLTWPVMPWLTKLLGFWLYPEKIH
jgi:antibiotic biosynthesis monooxygenase (ABM) superfamily enzyme